MHSVTYWATSLRFPLVFSLRVTSPNSSLSLSFIPPGFSMPPSVSSSCFLSFLPAASSNSSRSRFFTWQGVYVVVLVLVIRHSSSFLNSYYSFMIGASRNFHAIRCQEFLVTGLRV